VRNSPPRTSWATLNRRLNSPTGFRVLLSIFIVTAIVFSAVPLLHYFRGRSIMDYELWYDTGKHVLAGDEIFFFRSGKYDFMYPPTCALFLAGASLLGQAGLILLLVVINSATWFHSIRLAAILAAGERHVKNALLYLVPSLLLIVYIWSSYHLGQPHLVLLALMLGAFAALRAKREVCAGALIAIAASIKAFPAIAIIYLVYRRYWKAAASLVVTLAFLLLILPAPFRGFERAWRDLEKWSVGMLKYDATGVAQRPMRGYSWKNQSIVGVGNRLLRHIDTDAAPGPHTPIYVNFADLKFATVNAILISVALALGILFMAAMPQRAMRTPESDAIEFALLVLMILMTSPLSFGYFFSWLMLPFAVITQRVLAGKGAALLWWSLPALALLALALFSPQGAQTYGNTIFGTLLLFIGLAIELLRYKRKGRQMQPAADLAPTNLPIR
jgi:positive regulator of sigma E activity